MRVLIVEDDEDLRLALEHLLHKLGYCVESVEDGASALGRIEQADALITDISLTGMNGLDLCGYAKNRRPLLGVIVMTGYDSPAKREEAMRRGATVYLPKPFEMRDLLASLAQIGEPLRSAVREVALR